MYKAIDKKTKEWVFGVPCDITPNYCVDEPHEKEILFVSVDSFADWGMPKTLKYYYVEPETVCEYTGCEDLDGKEIYEGDILDAEWGNKKYGAVTFKDGMFKCHDISLCTWIGIPEYCCKVIGNIHDCKK